MNYDVQEVKQLADGRWPEILNRIGGIPLDILDGKHHPCPRCGGVDRFRFDTEKQFAYCNQCFNHDNGDGLAAIQWFMGYDFPTALRKVVELFELHKSTKGNNPMKSMSKVVATYDYRDENNKLCKQIIRKEPKEFCQRAPKEGGGWSYSVKGVPELPYRLPELINANPDDPVWIVEGEKDVDRLYSLQCIATCNAGGAGKWRSEFARYFEGRQVVILPDNDEPGKNHAQQIAASLTGVAASVKVVDLPGVPEKGDVSDWLDQGHTIDDLWKITRATPEWKHVSAIEPLDDIESTPLPNAVDWPIMDEAAYHGLAGQIVRLIEPETESDPVAILIQFLAGVGIMIGRLPYFIVEGTRHYANLFAVLVGKTAKGRKGTSEGRVRQIIRSVDESWEANGIKSGLSSGEGLIYHVRNPIYKIENIKERGIIRTEKVLADAGVDDKRLLVMEGEYANVLRVCKRETNTLSPVIRSAWDSGNLSTLTKNSPVTATDAHIGMIGHITQEELRESQLAVDAYNGFQNRFLWLLVRRSRLLPDGGQDLNLSTYTNRLREVVTAARSISRMHRNQAATAFWRKAYYQLANDDATGLVAAVTSRAEAQVLRLSMIYALLDGTKIIQDEHLRAAWAIWNYCRQSVQIIFGSGTSTLEQRVLTVIRQQPGIGRKGIYQALGNHVKGKELADTLAKLRDSGKIRLESTPQPGGGRAIEQWYPCEHCEQVDIAKRPWESTEGESSQSSQSSQRLPIITAPDLLMPSFSGLSQ